MSMSVIEMAVLVLNRAVAIKDFNLMRTMSTVLVCIMI